jgi:surface antigen
LNTEKSKTLHLKIYNFQKKVADFVKRHQTIKLIHVLRNYSALVVVVSSAILVTATNVASGKNDGNFLFGYWGGTDAPQNVTSIKVARKTDLALAPLAKSNLAIDPDAKDDSENMVILQRQGLVSGSNAPMKDPEENGGVKIYEVQSGDTVSSIAMVNHITVNTILWANDLDNVDSIRPGDKLFILPVAGLSYTIRKGDDLNAIATKFKADREKIIAFNSLPADGKIEEGESIFIPGGQKDTPQSNTSSGNAIVERRQYATTTGGTPAVSGFKKLEGKAGTGHRFPYGYCTWYVAQRRFVPWSGNAGTWLYQAKSLGYKTGKTPAVGAIMVSAESWWGHVAVVESVGNGSFTVSEMNYKGWAKKSSRVVSNSNRVIKGFIY